MKLIYSGKTKEFTPEFEERVILKLAKLSKISEQRGEREVHFVHQVERHLHKVEILMNFYDHPLVGEGSDVDLTVALTQAAEKLEKQLLKHRDRWRDTHRDAKAVRSDKENWDEAPISANSPVEKPGKMGVNGTERKPKIFRVNYDDGRKPMTLEEALLEMDDTTDYMVYRNSQRNCLSILVKRPDGNFDLIES
ncbi:MAG: ribosome hibernation-promoting factor, HPF/YfiA family [Bryobacteraceae bacterium]